MLYMTLLSPRACTEAALKVFMVPRKVCFCSPPGCTHGSTSARAAFLSLPFSTKSYSSSELGSGVPSPDSKAFSDPACPHFGDKGPFLRPCCSG